MRRTTVPAAVSGVLAVLTTSLAACDGTAADVPLPTPVEVTGNPSPDPAIDEPTDALALIPIGATAATITDWDRIRARLGQQSLTTDSPMVDRSDFWRRAEAEVVLLTQGGLEKDELAWEVRFTGNGPAGLVQMTRDGELRTQGTADPHDADWAAIDGLAELVDPDAESTYLRRGCLPLHDALGPDARAEDQDRVTSRHDVRRFDDLAGFSLGFTDEVATARLGADRDDLIDRADVLDDWPDTGAPAFDRGFSDAVNDPLTGRIGFHVRDPLTAAELTLTDELPFAICNEVVPMVEPT